MSFDLAAMKKELAALALPSPLALASPFASPKPKAKRNAPKFDEWNAFILETQKDLARKAGIHYESYPSHAAFIKAAGEKGCGRIVAMKEASSRREEATGKKAFVKARAEKWAAAAETRGPMDSPQNYRERWEKRWYEQNELEEPLPIALPKPVALALPKPVPLALPKPVALALPKPVALKRCPSLHYEINPITNEEKENALQTAGLTHPWELKLVNGCRYFIHPISKEALDIQGDRAGEYDEKEDIVDATEY